MPQRAMPGFKEILAKADSYEKKYIDTLDRLIRHPSVAVREPVANVECARELEDILREHGYKVSEYPIVGAPIVCAEMHVGAKKTLMFYHHYDVQPERDHSLWDSPPWKLTARGGRLYGRGTSDDKAPIVTSILAMDHVGKMLGGMPVNVKFVVEGQEEAGSFDLPKFAKEKADFLKADGLVWEGASGIPGSPAEVACGLKGDAYFELTTTGPPKFPRTDVHSGEAGAIPNAAWRLVWALSTLKDENENITIDGFNELVRPPSEEDVEALRQYKGDIEKRFKGDYGLDRLVRDRTGVELLMALYLRPVLSITGLMGGDQTDSDMTIIPSKAKAKLDFRLVPDLTTDDVRRLLRAHLDARGFTDIDTKFTTGYNAAKTPIGNPFVKMVVALAEEVASPSPASVLPMTGGSGPAYLFVDHAPLCMPYSYADLEGVNTHAPNENVPVEGIVPSIAFNALLALRMSD